MRSTVRFVLLVVLAFAVSPAGAAPDGVRVPRAKAPIVDGTISPGEWDQARVETLANGGEVRLQHDGEFLYVGLRVPEGGVGSLCVPGGPKRILVLHASAALGTAAYEATDAGWRLTRKFVFELRDTGAGAEAMRQRAAFLAAEGWFSNTSPRGSREREYQIAWKLGDGRGLPLAVVYMTFPGERVHVWPAGLDDASASPEIVKGNLPETARFDAAKWAVVSPG